MYTLSFGLIFLLSQCVTSRYISKPCPTKSYSVDSSIKAANITKEEIAKNLQFRLNLFRNATQKLIEKYRPPNGRRITSDRTIVALRSKKIMKLDVTSPFYLEPSKLTNASLLDVYRNLTLIANFLDLVKKDEDQYSHGEFSFFIQEANKTLHNVLFDLHTILRLGHSLKETECMEIENMDKFRTSNNQFRFYRDWVIFNEIIAYVDHFLSLPNAPTIV